MDKEELKRKADESEEQFVWRLCFGKDSGVINMTWDELAEILNAELREDESDYLSSSAYRKNISMLKKCMMKCLARWFLMNMLMILPKNIEN